MKRISLIILGGLALVLLVSAYAQTPTQQTSVSTQAQQTKRDRVLTPDMQREYVQLIKSRSSEEDVQSWARKHKLQIVHLKEYDILVPEQPPRTNPEEVGACDYKQCPKAGGGYDVKNTNGKVVGYQPTTCTASSCNWVKNPTTGTWNRMCGGWKCEDAGGVINTQ